MPTGDILQCELETHHARAGNGLSCGCGFRKYPLTDEEARERFQQARNGALREVIQKHMHEPGGCVHAYHPADIAAEAARLVSERTGIPLADDFDEMIEKMRDYFDATVVWDPESDSVHVRPA